MTDLAVHDLELRAKCGECDTSFPIGALVEALPCPECNETFDLDAAWYLDALGDDENLNETDEPTCPGCGETFAIGEVHAQLERGACACPRCAVAIGVRPAPTRLAISGYVYLLGEDPDQLGGAAPVASRPVVFKCPECDGALRVDGSSRTVPCSHCQAEVYLPDGLWKQLRPSRKTRSIAAVFDRAVRAGALGTAQDPAATTEALERLALHLSHDVRVALARHPRLSARALDVLADVANDDVLEAVGEHASTPPETLATLAEDGVSEAARNPHLPTASFATLVTAEQTWIRAALAANPAAPPAILAALATDAEPDVCIAVAENPATPPATLELLAADERDLVRAAVALSPRAPAAALRRIAETRDYAAYSFDLAERLARGGDAPAFHARIYVAKEDGPTGVTLHAIVAAHPEAPAEALAVLAGHRQHGVRLSVAEHPRTPLEALVRLAKDRTRRTGEPSAAANAARQHPTYAERPSWLRRLFS